MAYNLCGPISILLKLSVSMYILFTCLFGGWLWMGQTVLLDNIVMDPTNQKHVLIQANQKHLLMDTTNHHQDLGLSTNHTCIPNRENQSWNIPRIKLSTRYHRFQRGLSKANDTNVNKSSAYTQFLYMYFLSGKSRITKDQEYAHAPRRISEVFSTSINTREERIFRELMQKFVEIAREHDLTYFLYSGSLLGSYRHHGMIPWDDDIDVVMNFTQSDEITRAFSHLWPHFFLYTKQRVRWKLYASLSHPIRGSPWGWPFIDISFYRENQTHIWDSDPVFSTQYCYEKSKVFPLIQRPFNGELYLAPRKTEQVLRQTYDIATCQSNMYSHRFETNLSKDEQRRVPCYMLKDMTPLVVHNKTYFGYNETLLLGKKAIHSILVPS